MTPVPFRIATLAIPLFVMLAPGEVSAIADPSFELLPAGTDLETGSTFTADLLSGWGIDSAIVVSAENGITPEDGSQMARANSGVGTDLYTLVDVTSMAAEIAAGELFVDISAFFNSVDPNEFHISLRAFTGPFDFGFGGQLGPQESAPLLTDADPLTWEMGSLTGYQVPLGANYVAVGLHNDLFDPGNPSYFDSAEITFSSVPEPASPALLLCGVLIFGTRRLHARRARRRLSVPFNSLPRG